jgi:hypothetical protein
VERKKHIWFKNLTKKEVSLVNKNVVIFAFFLFLAFVFWYLNALGKEIKSNIKYPVSFINPPKGRGISSDLPLKLSLDIRGQGYALLRHKISVKKTSLVVDLSKVTFRRIPSSKPTIYYILSGTLISNLNRQIGNGFEVLSVKPDTIFLTFNVTENVQGKKAD